MNININIHLQCHNLYLSYDCYVNMSVCQYDSGNLRASSQLKILAVQRLFDYQAGITKQKKDTTWYLPTIPEDTEIRPFEIKHISGLLIFWIIGVGLGIVIFIVELVIK